VVWQLAQRPRLLRQLEALPHRLRAHKVDGHLHTRPDERSCTFLWLCSCPKLTALWCASSWGCTLPAARYQIAAQTVPEQWDKNWF
jgi:hypothetical protein